MTPSPVNATIDGRSTRPSASGITFGTPPSTYATKLLVVPRSMPTMRDMALFALSERVLDLQHLLEEIRGRPGLDLGPLLRLPALLEGDQVRHPREGIAERPVGPVDRSRALEHRRLRLLAVHPVEVGMVPARQLVEPTLQRVQVHL